MPEVTREEMGRRLFQVKKEKAVESAIDKIRQSLGPDWIVFFQGEIVSLHSILGEMWVLIPRETWERYSFSRLKKADIADILSIEKAWKQKTMSEEEAIKAFDAVFSR